MSAPPATDDQATGVNAPAGQSPPTVALIHATPAAMSPARAAMADRFPQATVWNLLDDLLITQADTAGGVTPPLRRRMLTLIGHAVDAGAAGVLLTCSMYGFVAQEAAADQPIPVLAPDEALFTRVAELRPATVAVLGPLRTGVTDTVTRLTAHLAGATGSMTPTVTGTVIPAAGAASASGDRPALISAVVEAVTRAAGSANLIVLGNFSLDAAAEAAAAAVQIPVLSPARLAADALRRRIIGPPS